MHIFKTTHKQYKDILKDWFKGTGGGSGLASQFETWDVEKKRNMLWMIHMITQTYPQDLPFFLTFIQVIAPHISLSFTCGTTYVMVFYSPSITPSA